MVAVAPPADGVDAEADPGVWCAACPELEWWWVWWAWWVLLLNPDDEEEEALLLLMLLVAAGAVVPLAAGFSLRLRRRFGV